MGRYFFFFFFLINEVRRQTFAQPRSSRSFARCFLSIPTIITLTIRSHQESSTVTIDVQRRCRIICIEKSANCLDDRNLEREIKRIILCRKTGGKWKNSKFG